uniref:Cytochrome P450 CYP3020A1 n=1 Tax=Tigriopus kingsejongensis TaxID=1133412 RepID=A0A2H4FY86_9MAXI|nr:cytochrome P450 CYP3020A1 [Tigriopus kingsejongensis]
MVVSRKLLVAPTQTFQVLVRAQTTAPHVRQGLKPWTEIPGPTNIPFLGNFLSVRAPGVEPRAWNFHRLGWHLGDRFQDMCRLEIPLRSPYVFLFTPELCEKLYRSIGPRPIRPGFSALDHIRRRDPTFTNAKGLLTSQGEEWYQFRKKVQRPMLNPMSVLPYHRELQLVADEFIAKKIHRQLDENSEVPDLFLDDLYKWACESVCVIALNQRVGCLEVDLPPESEQLKIINGVSTILKTTADLDNGIHFWKYFPSSSFKAFTEACDIFKETCFKYIHKSLEEIKHKPHTADADKTLLEQFHDRGCDEATTVVMALDMIFGGIDTTSHTVAFALYNLAMNPKTQETVFQEIKSVLPEASSPIPQSIDKLPYLKAVVKETLRVNPAAIANARTLSDPLELNGYLLEPGTNVVPFHYYIMNCDRFVEEPKAFKPERWIKGHAEFENIHPFAALPFGHGVRMCIGKRFAEYEVQVMLMKLIRKYRVEWHHEPLGMKIHTLSFPSKPLRFRFFPR